MVVKSVEKKQELACFSKKKLVLPAILGAIYLLCAVRYFPGRPLDTLVATADHLLTSIPFSLGFTLVVITGFAKVSGQRPGAFFVVRLFFTIGLIVEFFIGLYNYLAAAA